MCLFVRVSVGGRVDVFIGGRASSGRLGVFVWWACPCRRASVWVCLFDVHLRAGGRACGCAYWVGTVKSVGACAGEVCPDVLAMPLAPPYQVS